MSSTLAPSTRSKTTATAVYEHDVYAWALQQARLIRERRFDELDMENISEEIESVGKSAKTELRNRLSTLVEHLLKLEASRSAHPRHGWRNTVRRSRAGIASLLSESPNLQRELDRMLPAVQADTVRVTADMLEDSGEFEAAEYARTQEGGFTREELFEDWFPGSETTDERVPRRPL